MTDHVDEIMYMAFVWNWPQNWPPRGGIYRRWDSNFIISTHTLSQNPQPKSKQMWGNLLEPLATLSFSFPILISHHTTPGPKMQALSFSLLLAAMAMLAGNWLKFNILPVLTIDLSLAPISTNRPTFLLHFPKNLVKMKIRSR